MKKSKVLFIIILCICLSFSACAYESDIDKKVSDTVDAVYYLCQTDHPLKNQKLYPAGDSGSDWIALSLSAAGETKDTGHYLRALKKYVKDVYNGGGFDIDKITDCQRIAITCHSLGGDPQRFGKDRSGNSINLIADCSYNFKGDFSKSNLNAVIFALISLDCGDFSVPKESKYSREDIVNLLISRQNGNGCFGLTGELDDIDLTAMALQALAPYKDGAAKDSIQRALDYISAGMDDTGDFATHSPESISQVIIALCDLGIDIDSDKRFIKNNVTLLRSLDKYRLTSGEYVHSLADSYSDMISTTQALLALSAVKYSNKPYRLSRAAYDNSCLRTVSVSFVCVSAAVVIMIMIRRKKNV